MPYVRNLRGAEMIPATRVGVVRERITDGHDRRECPRCGVRRQVRHGTDPLCSDCRLVDPGFLKRAERRAS